MKYPTAPREHLICVTTNMIPKLFAKPVKSLKDLVVEYLDFYPVQYPIAFHARLGGVFDANDQESLE
ncbi:hypothetical protein ACTXT7_008622 [Hymenolepis weldensis]